MVDEKQAERKPLVPLVAVDRGFYKGSMVEPGKTFMFDPNPRTPGGQVKWPKWAKSADQAKQELAQKAARMKGFDTKPKEAATAARNKAAGLSGVDLA